MDFRQASHPTTPMHHFINLAQGKRLFKGTCSSFSLASVIFTLYFLKLQQRITKQHTERGGGRSDLFCVSHVFPFKISV